MTDFILTPDTYSPILDEHSNYIDHIPSFPVEGLRCPCGAGLKRSISFTSATQFTKHVHTLRHQKWLKALNANKQNVLKENAELLETVKTQQQLLVRFDRDLKVMQTKMDDLLSMASASSALISLSSARAEQCRIADIDEDCQGDGEAEDEAEGDGEGVVIVHDSDMHESKPVEIDIGFSSDEETVATCDTTMTMTALGGGGGGSGAGMGSLNAASSKHKKLSIPKRIRDEIWDSAVGKDIPKHKCLCCKKNYIFMRDFHVGHVLSEKDGGTMVVNNLRPICATCNLSMGTQNMVDFIVKYGLYL